MDIPEYKKGRLELPAYQMPITKTREVFSLPNIHYAPLSYVLSLINPRMCTYANFVAYSYLIYNNGILK